MWVGTECVACVVGCGLCRCKLTLALCRLVARAAVAGSIVRTVAGAGSQCSPWRGPVAVAPQQKCSISMARTGMASLLRGARCAQLGVVRQRDARRGAQLRGCAWGPVLAAQRLCQAPRLSEGAPSWPLEVGTGCYGRKASVNDAPDPIRTRKCYTEGPISTSLTKVAGNPGCCSVPIPHALHFSRRSAAYSFMAMAPSTALHRITWGHRGGRCVRGGGVEPRGCWHCAMLPRAADLATRTNVINRGLVLCRLLGTVVHAHTRIANAIASSSEAAGCPAVLASSLATDLTPRAGNRQPNVHAQRPSLALLLPPSRRAVPRPAPPPHSALCPGQSSLPQVHAAIREKPVKEKAARTKPAAAKRWHTPKLTLEQRRENLKQKLAALQDDEE